jgi:aspartate aminotransferase
MSDIDTLRDQIDKITLEMIRLLKDRVEISKQIGSLKNNLGLGVTNEERESQLRAKVISLCKDIGLDERIATMLLNFLLNESIKIQSSGKQTHLSVFLKAKSLELQGKKIIHMEVGEPDFHPPKVVKKALSQVYDKGFTKYGESKGMLEFRIALAKKTSEPSDHISGVIGVRPQQKMTGTHASRIVARVPDNQTIRDTAIVG